MPPRKNDPIRELERTAERRQGDILEAAEEYELAFAAGEKDTRKHLEELRAAVRDRRAAVGAVSEAKAARDATTKTDAAAEPSAS